MKKIAIIVIGITILTSLAFITLDNRDEAEPWDKIRPESQAQSDVQNGSAIIYYSDGPVGLTDEQTPLVRNIEQVDLGYPLPSNVYGSAARYNYGVLKEVNK